MQCIKPVGDADCVLGFAISSKFRLESLDLRPKNIPAAIKNARYSLINFSLQFKVSFVKIKEQEFVSFDTLRNEIIGVIAKIVGFLIAVGGQNETNGARMRNCRARARSSGKCKGRNTSG